MATIVALLLRGGWAVASTWLVIVAGLLVAHWAGGQLQGRTALLTQIETLQREIAGLEPQVASARADLAAVRRALDAEVATRLAQSSQTLDSLGRAVAETLARRASAKAAVTLARTRAQALRYEANRAWNRLPWWARTEKAIAWSSATRAWWAQERAARTAETAVTRAERAVAELDAVLKNTRASEASWRRQRERQQSEVTAKYAPQLRATQRAIDAVELPLNEKIATLEAAERRLGANLVHRASLALREVLPLSLLLLVGYFVVPLLWRVLAYYGLSRLVSADTPVQLAPPDATRPNVPVPSPSAVSVEVELAPTEELRVRSAYLQRSTLDAARATAWLLSPSYALSSLAAGMFVLTRVRTRDAATTRVRVTATDDALGELAVIEVPAGQGLVLRPSSLAGVVHARDREVTIRRHWRPLNLHALFSWQLRFLEFVGPCRLIVRGARGVQVDALDGARSHQINGSATLGFAPAVPFRVRRCETFVDYLLGRAALLDDMFGPGHGVIVYEERPSGRDGAVLLRTLRRGLDAFRQGLGI